MSFRLLDSDIFDYSSEPESDEDREVRRSEQHATFALAEDDDEDPDYNFIVPVDFGDGDDDDNDSDGFEDDHMSVSMSNGPGEEALLVEESFSVNYANHIAGQNESDSINVGKALLSLVVMKHAISKRALEEIFEGLALLYGFASPVPASEIWENIKKNGDAFRTSSLMFCTTCKTQLFSKNSGCMNDDCARVRLPIKNGSQTSEGTILFYSLQTQLEYVLGQHLDEIIQHHRKIHYIKKNGQPRNVLHHQDFRNSYAYETHIESPEQFDDRQIQLVGIISFDGARPAKITKREWTPLLVKIESISQEFRNREENILLSALHSSTNGVAHEDIPNFTSQLLKELEGPLKSGNQKSVKGITWTVTLNLIGVISDLKGIRVVSGIPNWQTSNGCNVCLTNGVSYTGKYSFNQVEDAQKRTIASCMENMFNRRMGFTKESYSKFAVKFLACMFFIERFHIKQQGVFKKLVSELAVHKWKWSQLIRNKRKVVETALNSTKSVTGRTDIFSLKSNGIATGNQIKAMSLIALPVAALENVFVDPSYGVFLVAIIAATWNERDESKYDHIQKIYDDALELFVLKEPERVTLKFHQMFKHEIDHLRVYGTKFDMEIFEKLHMIFQKSVNAKATNGLAQYGDRFVSMKKIRLDLIRSLPTMKEKCRSIVGKSLNSRTEENTTKLKNLTNPEQLLGEHLNEVEKFCELSDVVSFGTKVRTKLMNGREVSLASETYRNELKTTQSYARLKINDQKVYVRILLFFEVRQTVFMLCDELITQSFLSSLQPLLDSVTETQDAKTKKLTLSIKKNLEKVDLPFEKIVGGAKRVFSITNLVDMCTCVFTDDDVYITPVH